MEIGHRPKWAELDDTNEFVQMKMMRMNKKEYTRSD